MNSHRTRPVFLSVAVAALAVALLGCTAEESPTTTDSPTDVLAAAADSLARTSGVELTLTSIDFPDSTNGVVSAKGEASTAPAFEGVLSVQMANTPFEVPVVAVDDVVWAQIPLTQGWSQIDPADYSAPDPALLLSSTNGVIALVESTTELERGESVRGGADNDEVLTTFTGTVPGDVMEQVIPSSAGDSFDLSYLVDGEGLLREVAMTGVFYEETPPMTYEVTLDSYGIEPDVQAPEASR